MSDINPLMVMLGRESRGYTQTALAKKIGIQQGTLSKVESGQMPATDDLVERLSENLGYPKSFFSQQPSFRQLPLSFFRKKARVSATTVKAIRARANIRRLHIEKLTAAAELPILRILQIDAKESHRRAEQAAKELRIHWHLPPGPIKNLTAAIENSGILVVPFDFETGDVDGVSFHEPNDDLPPIIFVRFGLPGDRMRFTLAHELAHIVLHHHLAIPRDDVDIEGQAHAFAAEFLMPAEDIRGYLGNLTLAKLASLKTYWKVAMQSLLVRATTLGKITDRKARYLWMQMGKLGYRTEEPVPIPAEQPKLIRELVQFHLDQLRYTEDQLSELLAFDPSECRSQYFSATPGLRVVR